MTRFPGRLALVTLFLLVGLPIPLTETASATENVWSTLRRPLHLPTFEAGQACPRSEGRRVLKSAGFAGGDGPVYATLGPDGVFNGLGDTRQVGGWFTLKVLWFATANYDGPVLIRGKNLDGSSEVRFVMDYKPLHELEFRDGGFSRDDPGARFWATNMRIRGPSCYAFQVDGEDFSDVIVFEALRERPEDLTPIPDWGTLPRGLAINSAIPLDAGVVRLALMGERRLVLRLDVSTDKAPEQTSDARLLTLPNGTEVHWTVQRSGTQPKIATWEHEQRHYRLETLDAAAGAWTEADLTTFVTAWTT